MSIVVNPAPTPSPEDREVLRAVYQEELDALLRDARLAAAEARSLTAEMAPLMERRAEARYTRAKKEGAVDHIRRLAERDGVTLTFPAPSPTRPPEQD